MIAWSWYFDSGLKDADVRTPILDISITKLFITSAIGRDCQPLAREQVIFLQVLNLIRKFG